MRGGRVYSVPSVAAVDWQANAISQLKRQWSGKPISGAVNVRALIYRQARIGDLCGFLQAIGDALQGGHGKGKIPCVLVDDRQIESWDGSRPLVDRKNPRVEIKIVAMLESEAA